MGDRHNSLEIQAMRAKKSVLLELLGISWVFQQIIDGILGAILCARMNEKVVDRRL